MITYQRVEVTAAAGLQAPTRARWAAIVVEGDGGRFVLDGSTPDGTLGIPFIAAATFDLETNEEINGFRCISTGTTVLHLHYYDKPRKQD